MGKAMVPIEVIAALVCEEIGDNIGVKKMRVMQYIALGWQQIHLYNNKDVSIRSIVIPRDRIMELPNDFVYETKVGLKHNDRICTLRQNSSLARNVNMLNDSSAVCEIESVLYDDCDLPDDCYFHNCYYGETYLGALRAFGRGYANNRYYDIQNGQIHVSSNMPEDAELVVEYKSDGLSDGLKLVPSELFLALKHFAHAQLKGEGVNGENQVAFESQVKTVARLHRTKTINTLASLFS